MSVYCIGKLMASDSDTHQSLLELARRFRLGLSFVIDHEDEEVMCESPVLRGDGVSFAIFSAEGESDVVEAWNQAQALGLEALEETATEKDARSARIYPSQLALPARATKALRRTSIGGFVSELVMNSKVEGGVAFFDGSIREIVEGDRKECVQQLLAGFLSSWDCARDALFVWR